MTTRRIADILRAGQPDETAKIHGWVRTKRELKDFAFVEINDGSSMANLQVVLNADLPNYAEILKQVNTGTSLEIEGILVASPAKGQRCSYTAMPIRKRIRYKRNATPSSFYGQWGTCDRAPTLSALSSASATPALGRSTNSSKNAVFCGFTPPLSAPATAKEREKCSPSPALI
jgi:OB-fold nucleic acid binding domain